jgi:hypothetical protein
MKDAVAREAEYHLRCSGLPRPKQSSTQAQVGALIMGESESDQGSGWLAFGGSA